MVFYGASGHGKVIIDAWVLSGGVVTGIVDDNIKIKRLGPFAVFGKYEPSLFPGVPLVIAIGNNEVRKTISGKVTASFGKVLHPAATIAKSALISVGTVVMAGAIVNADARIGEHAIVNTGAVVDHDCVVGDFVHVSPNATLCGGVVIGEGAHIGAGATVIQNIKIGKWAVIGAGSVVIEDVPDYALVVGVPGKIKRFCKPN